MIRKHIWKMCINDMVISTCRSWSNVQLGKCDPINTLFRLNTCTCMSARLLIEPEMYTCMQYPYQMVLRLLRNSRDFPRKTPWYSKFHTAKVITYKDILWIISNMHLLCIVKLNRFKPIISGDLDEVSIESVILLEIT